ncbi:MAG: histidine--tRNA ligase [Deltaproteobacteria bacterium]|nr:histidine--tRNA ligase [Deltaproteobacteria bacterium]
MKKLQSLRGMEDLYEELQVRLWQEVESKAAVIFEKAGFTEIRTPILELKELFARGVGETSDIVSKEMYELEDRKGQKLALRPEGTASVVRAFIQHYTSHQIQEGRFYYKGPMFRYERPQAGRLRQFHQIGAELFGSNHPMADVEMISLLEKLLRSLHLKEISLQINSLGLPEERQAYREALQGFLKKIEDLFSEDFKERVQKNPLRVLDSKDPKVQEALKEAPKLEFFLSEESRVHFKQVQEFLDLLKIDYQINPYLVRGLDYYDQTVFEFLSGDLGAQNAVAGGGRYNHLVASFGGPSVPAVGFALGMERLVSLLDTSLLKTQAKRVYFIALDLESTKLLLPKLEELRQDAVIAQIDLSEGSLKAKLKRAHRWEADLVIILGEGERQKQSFLVKDMASGEQFELSWQDFRKKLKLNN